MNNIIVIASSDHAYIYKYNLERREIILLKDLESKDTKAHIHDLVRDKRGRTFDTASTEHGLGHHGVEPHLDAHKKAIKAFARQVARDIDNICKNHSQLILIAPPHFLGELKLSLGKESSKSLITTLDKDLTKIDIEELPKIIEKNLGVTLNYLLLAHHA